MTLGDAIALMRGSVLETLVLAAPILLLAMAVGLLVAILQATTAIQEQTLSFVPKIAAILVGLILFGSFIFQSMISYTKRLFEMIPGLGG
jgi:flagellar biosynthetic protein FliQ